MGVSTSMAEAMNKVTDGPKDAPVSKTDDDEVKRRSKTTPKKTVAEKFEDQKRTLQRGVFLVLEEGKKSGLTLEQVIWLSEALTVLGWLPEDIRR